VHVLGQLLFAAEEDDAWAAAGLEGSDASDDDSDAGASDGGGGGDPLGSGEMVAAGRRVGGIGGDGGGALYAAGLLEAGLEGDVAARSAAGTPAAEDPEDAADPLAAVPLREVVRRGLAPVAAQDPGEWGGRQQVVWRHGAGSMPRQLMERFSSERLSKR
jgi:hypothetical protein